MNTDTTDKNALRARAQDAAKPGRTIEHVASFAVTLIEEHLDEQILFLNADALESRFGSDVWVGTDEAHRLIELFSSDGGFKSRNTVEADQTAVQALPVVVVRNQSGHVLQLKRRERRRDNPFNVKAQDLATNIDNGLVSEPWSVEIARNLLPEVSQHLARPTML